MAVSRRERLVEFFRRLLAAPNAATFDEAVHLITSTMDAVEDEMAGIPYNPENWRFDGRIYPPRLDNMYAVPGHPRVKRFRSLAHNTYVGMNGSIEIGSLDGTVELVKPGLDGRNVWELESTA
jgi:hypothetical protein